VQIQGQLILRGQTLFADESVALFIRRLNSYGVKSRPVSPIANRLSLLDKLSKMRLTISFPFLLDAPHGMPKVFHITPGLFGFNCP